jgi:hypothetical protein
LREREREREREKVPAEDLEKRIDDLLVEPRTQSNACHCHLLLPNYKSKLKKGIKFEVKKQRTLFVFI